MIHLNYSIEFFTRRMVGNQQSELCKEFSKFVEKLNQSRIKLMKKQLWEM